MIISTDTEKGIFQNSSIILYQRTQLSSNRGTSFNLIKYNKLRLSINGNEKEASAPSPLRYNILIEVLAN